MNSINELGLEHEKVLEFGGAGSTGRYRLALSDVLEPLKGTEVFLDKAPVKLSGTRVLAAGLLLSYPDFQGTLRFDGTVDAFASDFWSKALGTQLIVSKKMSESGDFDNHTRTFVLDSVDLGGPTPGRDETNLCLIRSEKYAGALTGVKELIVPTNIWMFDATDSTKSRAALGILYSQDLLTSEIVLPEPADSDFLKFANLVGEPLEIQFTTK